MPISVTCPECQATFRVGEETTGKAITCKKCGARVPVPAENREDQAKSTKARGGQQADRGGGSESRTKKKGGSGKILIIVGGVVVLGCCLCSGAGVALPFVFPGLRFWNVTPVVKDAKEIAIKEIKEKDKDGGKGPNVLLQHKDILLNTDPQDMGKPSKPFEVKFEQGKVYVIELKSTFKDQYLRLYDPKRTRVAEDGQFPDARITFMAKRSGNHQIRVTTFKGVIPPEGVDFSLTVRER